jgi:hypothetical protein
VPVDQVMHGSLISNRHTVHVTCIQGYSCRHFRQFEDNNMPSSCWLAFSFRSGIVVFLFARSQLGFSAASFQDSSFTAV